MKISREYLVLILSMILLVFLSISVSREPLPKIPDRSSRDTELLPKIPDRSSRDTEPLPKIFNDSGESLVYIPPSSESGTPLGKRRAIISRNPSLRCETQAQNCLVALVPELNWGYTNASRPTFWFYASGSITEALTFRLIDVKHETIIYETTIKLQQAEGIINIKLPPEIPELKIGQEYRWSFVYSPAINSFSGAKIYVFGRSKRILGSADLLQNLNSAKTKRERILIYAKNGFWQDALTLLAHLYQTEPNSEVLQKDWIELLDSVGLESLHSVPIVSD